MANGSPKGAFTVTVLLSVQLVSHLSHLLRMELLVPNLGGKVQNPTVMAIYIENELLWTIQKTMHTEVHRYSLGFRETFAILIPQIQYTGAEQSNLNFQSQ